MSARRKPLKRDPAPKKKILHMKAQWGECASCGQHLPIVPMTDLCGPCCFGEADTLLDEDYDIELDN